MQPTRQAMNYLDMSNTTAKSDKHTTLKLCNTPNFLKNSSKKAYLRQDNKCKLELPGRGILSAHCTLASHVAQCAMAAMLMKLSSPAVSAWPPLELPTPLSEAVLLLDSQLRSLSKSRILKKTGKLDNSTLHCTGYFTPPPPKISLSRFFKCELF